MVKKSLKPSEDKVWLKYYSKEIIDFKLPKKTIFQCIYDNNVNNQNRIAVEYYGKKVTYEELFANILATVKAFRALGIQKGDIITLCMPTTPETIYIYYALSRIGAISNMVDPRTSAEGIKEYINEVNSKIAVILDMVYDKIEPVLEETNVKRTISISVADSLPNGLKAAYNFKNGLNYLLAKNINVKTSDTNLTWNDFILNGELYIGDIDEPYEENRAVTIVHTGGTTGHPKGVLLSNDALNAVAYQYKNSGMHLIPGHTFLNIMPPFIAYGVGCGMHMPLIIGMTSICIPAFDPKKFADLILKHKPNHMAGVPSHWENLIKSKKFKNADLSFWFTAAVGGDGLRVPLEIEANKFLNKYKAPYNIVKGYGITEECSLAAACVNEHNKIGSVGIPLPQVNISVFEPNTDKELSYEEKGEICIHTPSMMLGYFHNQEETDKIIIEHSNGKKWIHTQDYGYIDKDGYIFIEGRIKRVIVRHDGFKVFPFIIEKTILKHDAVKEVMVVANPDIDHVQGDMPKAHIVLKEEFIDNQDIVIDEIKKLCEKELPEYVVPYSYKIREVMPLTPIGKIDFKALEAEDQVQNKEI